jgi:hemolysin activation/secretion protein
LEQREKPKLLSAVVDVWRHMAPHTPGAVFRTWTKFTASWKPHGFRTALLPGLTVALSTSLFAAEPAAPPKVASSTGTTNASAYVTTTNASLRFNVRDYVINADSLVFSNAPAPILSQYTGTNVSLARIVRAASEVLAEYQKRGYPRVNVSIAEELITNGIVTMHIYQGAFPQVLVSGNVCFSAKEAGTAPLLAVAAPGVTNVAAAKTNASPRFAVRGYEITGDTLLTTNVIKSIFEKRTGTNVALADIIEGASALQMEYRNRGYPTVKVTIPPQQITNGVVQLRVSEGRLSEIIVTHNRYFSSNNVMRALPSLRTNVILNGTLFEAEVDRANANQDRQIYPQLEEGPEENTTVLELLVRDRFPLHGKIELNNQNSPETPDLRLAASAAYNNLWQLEQSIGLQYSFSPEAYKSADHWNIFDRPLVANYGGFYRLPFGEQEAVENQVAANPGNFGYDERTHRFRLPPSSGRPELNFFASGSTVDTGLLTLTNGYLTAPTNPVSVSRQDVQQDVTINQDVGFRLSKPFASASGLLSVFSAGADFKTYELTSNKTNLFVFITVIHDQNNIPIKTNIAYVPTAVPTTHKSLDYAPLSFRFDPSLRDALGVTSFGLGLNVNAWYSGTSSNLGYVTGSKQSLGHWIIVTPSLSRDLIWYTNWILTLHADGQWANTPLISNEQYGIGGVNSVRGYQEGQVYGDRGWRIGFEQKTPPYVVGFIHGKNSLTVRGVIYMDYAAAFLIDPQGRPSRASLWGTGFGGAASLGPHFEARFLFSWPLLDVPGITAFSPRFNFALSAQF